jgi:carboxypeptidase Q
VDRTRYFWFHHSEADTVDKLDPDELNRCVAALAVMAYAVAEMPERLPR